MSVNRTCGRQAVRLKGAFILAYLSGKQIQCQLLGKTPKCFTINALQNSLLLLPTNPLYRTCIYSLHLLAILSPVSLSYEGYRGIAPKKCIILIHL
jgi:hypothetical protein